DVEVGVADLLLLQPPGQRAHLRIAPLTEVPAVAQPEAVLDPVSISSGSTWRAGSPYSDRLSSVSRPPPSEAGLTTRRRALHPRRWLFPSLYSLPLARHLSTALQ